MWTVEKIHIIQHKRTGRHVTYSTAAVLVYRMYLGLCVYVLYRGVFPVAYDLFQVVSGAQQEVFSPLIPVHHHGPINVHTKERQRHR